MDQFVIKSQTYDASVEKMTEALNSGKLTDSEKNQLEQNIASTLKKKSEVMNEFNKNNLTSEVADFRDPNLQNTSRNNLSYYLKARQERIGRDKVEDHIPYQHQMSMRQSMDIRFIIFKIKAR
ncbi:MAG: hypothetical protein MH321_07715 [Leptospiraceae bacterium]|nr:hypothetical protein [Leptospiraceae bacterium]